MAKLYNRVAVATATTGQGTITLGSALSGAFCTFAQAGAQDGDVVSYLITEGSDFEMGRGTYTASGTTLSRDTVLLSKISGTAGTTKMTLAGGAEVRIVAAAEDIAIGKVVQRQSTVFSTQTSTANTIPFDDTVPQNTEGAEAVTVTITPTKSTNKLVIRALLYLGTDASGAAAIAALFKDSEASARATGFWALAGDLMVAVEVLYEMTAGATSAMTFKMRYGSHAGTCYINRYSGGAAFNATVNSYIEVTEYEV